MLKGHLCSIYISPRRSLLHIKWMLKYWCVASSYECSKMTLASLWLNLPSIEAHWCTFAIHWCTHQSKQPKSSNTGAEDENVPFLVLKYDANFAEIQRNTALVLSQIQQNSSYIFCRYFVDNLVCIKPDHSRTSDHQRSWLLRIFVG